VSLVGGQYLLVKDNPDLTPRAHEGLISVVIAVCNEEAVIFELYNRLSMVLDDINLSWEIIFVEDSSIDRTSEYIRKLCKEDNRIRAMFLTRSFGHHNAITAGLYRAKGDHIIIMDGDLQHKPEDISRLFNEYIKGYDVVYCQRVTRQSWLKQKGSDILNYITNSLSDSKISINSGIFRIFSKRVKDDICSMKEVGRFITGMISWLGYPTTVINIHEDKRKAGKTKYSIFKLVNLFAYAIISFSTKPLLFATYVGFAISAVTFIWGAIFLVFSIFNGTELPGYKSLILSIFFLGGLTLFVLGIIGHYLSVMYMQLQGRPLYVVKDMLNIDLKN
jgi:dolichol-phosphate mannosyltransferase